MLVLTRKVGEGIIIGDDIKLTIVEIKGGNIRLGIDAPRDKKIHRQEVYDRIQNQNRAATNWSLDDLNALTDILPQPKGGKMNKIDSRFGEIEYDPAAVLNFPEGLIGFEDLHDFVVMPNEKEGPLFWIQSVDDPQVALVLTDPTNFFLDYNVAPDDAESLKLRLAEEDQFFSLVVVTVHPDRQITLNLAAPILFAPQSNKALQVILENSGYDVQTPLPTVEEI